MRTCQIYQNPWHLPPLIKYHNSSCKIYKRQFTQKLHRIGIVVFNPSPLSRPPAQNQY